MRRSYFLANSAIEYSAYTEGDQEVDMVQLLEDCLQLVETKLKLKQVKVNKGTLENMYGNKSEVCQIVLSLFVTFTEMLEDYPGPFEISIGSNKVGADIRYAITLKVDKADPPLTYLEPNWQGSSDYGDVKVRLFSCSQLTRQNKGQFNIDFKETTVSFELLFPRQEFLKKAS